MATETDLSTGPVQPGPARQSEAVKVLVDVERVVINAVMLPFVAVFVLPAAGVMPVAIYITSSQGLLP
jgi:hypothetical protein